MRIASVRCFLAVLSVCLLGPAIGNAADFAVADSSVVLVVPNPWSASKLAPHWGERPRNPLEDGIDYSRVTFFRIPVRCTIRIYTVDGDLVQTIEHPIREGGAPSRQRNWDLITRSSQSAVSGIYIFVVMEKDEAGNYTGKRQMGKFVIIR